MFYKTVTLSNLKNNLSIIGEVVGTMAMQVLHRGHSVKVVIEQERYFELLAAEASLKNPNARGPEYKPYASVKDRVDKLVKEMEDCE